MKDEEDFKEGIFPLDFYIRYSLMAGHLDGAKTLLDEIKKDIKEKNGINALHISLLESSIKSSLELIEDCNKYIYPEEKLKV